MTTKLIDSALDVYLAAYRALIKTEVVADDSITISFPFHLAAGHRIEITVTDLGNDRCILSDGGRTIGELESAGHRLTKQTKEKLETVANLSGLRLVAEYLTLEATRATLGECIQKFLEVSKMIGDVYLVHGRRARNEEALVAQVRDVLNANHILYRERDDIQGELDQA